MAARVADINPECDVRVVNDFVDARNVEVILGLTDDSDSGARHGPRRPDFVLDAIDAERDKAAVVACCVHHRVPILVTGGAGGVDTLSETVVEDLATATFNRLLQRVRRILRRDYGFPKGGAPRFPGQDASKKKQKKKGDKGGKFGVKAVYAPENANHFATAGTKGRGGIGCDGVGGSAVFVTGALGFRAASHIVIRLMEAAEEKKKMEGEAAPSGRATTGWRSRVWPRGNGDEGGGDGEGGGGGGGAEGEEATAAAAGTRTATGTDRVARNAHLRGPPPPPSPRARRPPRWAWASRRTPRPSNPPRARSRRRVRRSRRPRRRPSRRMRRRALRRRSPRRPSSTRTVTGTSTVTRWIEASRWRLRSRGRRSRPRNLRIGTRRLSRRRRLRRLRGFPATPGSGSRSVCTRGGRIITPSTRVTRFGSIDFERSSPRGPWRSWAR